MARELDEAGARLVVVDVSSDAVDGIDMTGLQTTVPSLCADASDPKGLLLAGLTHPRRMSPCCAVVP
ncbi:MAG: hypothetical protein M3Y32_03745 [Pseudomonadota bacterium]|nr:hypothetical protein [Pseudomonadota bacterium]